MTTSMTQKSEIWPRQSPDSGEMERLYHYLINAVDTYREQLELHPIAAICAEGALPESIAREFARIQYVDSVLWIPMLALIKGQVSSERLIQAVRANILCEAGYNGIPHVTLCRQFVESLGEPTFYGDYQNYAPRASHPIEIMNGLVGMSEEEIAGWLLVVETLVPIFFKSFRPTFAQLPNADLRYLDEHISVDGDEHSEWMREAVLELLLDRASFSKLLSGIHIGGRLTLSIPDVLYARTLRKRGI